MTLIRQLLLLVGFGVLVVACGSSTTHRIRNAGGRATKYEDPGTAGRVQGIGVEAQDIVRISDKMVRSMLRNTTLVARNRAQVIVDAEYFKNQSSSRLSLDLIVDKLRIELLRAANGRIVFIGRHAAGMVEKERRLKASGVVGSGTRRRAAAPMGGDYRLAARITSHTGTKQDGTRSNYFVFAFEMIDLETMEIVWGDKYEFQKSGQDDVVYN